MIIFEWWYLNCIIIMPILGHRLRRLAHNARRKLAILENAQHLIVSQKHFFSTINFLFPWLQCVHCRYVLDGYPNTIEQVQLLTESSIIPMQVIELTLSSKEVHWRGTSDRHVADRSVFKWFCVLLLLAAAKSMIRNDKYNIRARIEPRG